MSLFIYDWKEKPDILLSSKKDITQFCDDFGFPWRVNISQEHRL